MMVTVKMKGRTQNSAVTGVNRELATLAYKQYIVLTTDQMKKKWCREYRVVVGLIYTESEIIIPSSSILLKS